ncbi:hypothetical protein GH754_01565 [Salinibacillus xinjiangensis]|uniref:Uncharacterized protein n=1 Tax=Salinibacillus xinjiangensis TaxID=1229268 RepID=A0A6G1X1Z7_9BACI|nr:hypothetical protein [Salinibacillus xinjiangensis]
MTRRRSSGDRQLEVMITIFALGVRFVPDEASLGLFDSSHADFVFQSPLTDCSLRLIF